MLDAWLLALPDYTLIPATVGYIFAGVIGAIFGSFLNVVIHRVPREESIVFPNSKCPNCSAVIAFYDNIPIFSYLFLGGKCRGCKKRISPRYPAVELLTALLFVAVAWHDGLSLALPFDLIFVAAIVTLVFIDAEHMILPNVITYPGMVFAVVARLVVPLLGLPHFDDLPSLMHGAFTDLPVWAVSLIGAAIGAVIGGGSLWLMGWTWERLRGIEAMGLGDVKMLFAVGALLGWRLTVLTIFLGAMTGAIAGILVIAKQKDRDLQTQIPFGIFLGIGSIVALLFGDRMIAWYLEKFVPQ